MHSRVLPTGGFAGHPARDRSDGALWRALVSLADFPVSFRSAIDGAAFWLAGGFLLFYVITPDIALAEVYVKYLVAGSVILCCGLLVLARQVVCLSPAFLLGPFLLFVAGTMSFGYAAVRGGTNTFSSALVPLIVVAAPLFVPYGNSRTDSRRVARYMLLVFGAGAWFHVLWQVIGYQFGMKELVDADPAAAFGPQYFAASGVILYFMILAGFYRRAGLLALALGLDAVSLVLRPSSTLVFASLFTIGAIALCRLGLRRIFRAAATALLVLTLFGNLAILGSDTVARTVYSIEPYVKSDILQSKSNNEFRLAVIAAARAEMSRTSIWAGRGFIGDMDVSVVRYLKWFDKAEAPIHSDFLTLTVEGGLIGFALIATLFLGLAKLCWRGARLAHAAGDGGGEILFDACLAIDVVFAVYISFNPIMQMLQCVMPFLVSVPLAVFLAREFANVPAPARPAPP